MVVSRPSISEDAATLVTQESHPFRGESMSMRPCPQVWYANNYQRSLTVKTVIPNGRMDFLDTRVLCYYEEPLTRICDLMNKENNYSIKVFIKSAIFANSTLQD